MVATHGMRCSARGGFTLVEVLVVLAIIGVLVGIVTVGAQPDDRAVLRVEADRLAQLLELAAMESRLTGKVIVWTADETGYRFWRSSPDARWSEIRDNPVLRARHLPQGVAIDSLRIENMQPRDVMRLAFTPAGSTPAYSVEISLGAERCVIAASPVGDVRISQHAHGESGR